MNWKPILVGFAVGCIVATIPGKLAHSPSEPIVLHELVVKTVDSDTMSPVPVSGIRYPDHRDFTFSTAEPEKRILHRVNYGTESGVTRIVWVGRGSGDEYRFVLSADGYEDVIVPTEFIETTNGSNSGFQEQPDILRMKKAESGPGE
jgi:hypothetical protein